MLVAFKEIQIPLKNSRESSLGKCQFLDLLRTCSWQNSFPKALCAQLMHSERCLCRLLAVYSWQYLWHQFLLQTQATESLGGGFRRSAIGLMWQAAGIGITGSTNGKLRIYIRYNVLQVRFIKGLQKAVS